MLSAAQTHFDKYLPKWSISQNLEQNVVLVTQSALSHLSKRGGGLGLDGGRN